MVEMAAFAMGYRKKGRVRADSEISGFSKWKDDVGLSEIKKKGHSRNAFGGEVQGLRRICKVGGVL